METEVDPLLQESLTRGFYPTVKGGAKKRGGVKFVGCYLKGNSIIIKDVKKFYLEESKENQPKSTWNEINSETRTMKASELNAKQENVSKQIQSK